MIYDVFVEHFNKMIEKKMIKEELLYGDGMNSYETFLMNNFQKDMVVLLELSKLQITGVINMIATQAELVLKGSSQKEWKFNQTLILCLYYYLCIRCLKNVPINCDDILSEDIANILVDQAIFAFTNDFNGFKKRIRLCMKELLKEIGLRSQRIFIILFDKFFTILQNNNKPSFISKISKSICSEFKQLSKFLNEMAKSNLKVLSNKGRKTFCKILMDLILDVCEKDNKEFLSFLKNKVDISAAADLSSKISQFNSKKTSKTFISTEMTLLMLQPSVDKTAFLKKCSSFLDNKGMIKYMNLFSLGFRFFVLVYPIAELKESSKQMLQTFFDKVKQSKHLMSNYCNNIDFLISSLIHSTDLFNSTFFPFLIKDNQINIFLMLEKITRQLSIIGSSDEFKCFDPYDLVCFVPLILEKFTNPSSNSNFKEIAGHIIKSFDYYPEIFRFLVLNDQNFIFNFISYISKSTDKITHKALKGFFDSSFIHTQYSVDLFLKSSKVIVDFLFGHYQSFLSNNQFTKEIPGIFETISNYFQVYFHETTEIPKSGLDNIIDIFYSIEGMALVLLASPINMNRQKAFLMISNLIFIYEKLDLETQSNQFSLKEYKLLLEEAENAGPENDGSFIKKILRKTTVISRGVMLAFDTLYHYFVNLSLAFSPNLDVQKTEKTIIFDQTHLSARWIGVSSILYSLNTSKKTLLYEFTLKLIRDRSDLGNLISAKLPSSLNQDHFMSFVTFLSGWLVSIKNEEGIIDKSPQNMCTIRNLMKIFNELFAQDLWEKDMILTNTISDIYLQLVEFCDMLNGEEFRFSYSQSLLTVCNLLQKHEQSFLPNIRKNIAKILIVWLSSGNNLSNQYKTVVQNSIASMLDNLNLMDCVDKGIPQTPREQASSLFLYYFAAIKSRIDSGDNNSVSEVTPVLTCLLKKNLDIGMEHCLSMVFAEKEEVRIVFTNALAAVFKIPKAKLIEDSFSNLSLIDLLFHENFELAVLVSDMIPFSRAEIFAKALINAAILKGKEAELLESMAEVEINLTTESTKNTLFRGNSVFSLVISQYTRIVGNDWMIGFLKPLFLEVCDNCNKGITYIVDINKIRSDENIEENRKNFHELLHHSVNVINNACKIMPVGIKKEIKLIYKLVERKFGDFAYQILSGLLFLRYLLPNFTQPRSVGISDDAIPMKSRNVLIQLSSVLMAAVLKGKLEDKNTSFQMFNDDAQQAYAVFKNMFKEIIENDINEEDTPEVFIDEEKVTQVIHTEIWPIQQQLHKTYSSNKKTIKYLIAKLQEIGPPKAKNNIILTKQSEKCPTLSKSLNIPLSEFPTTQDFEGISDFIAREVHNANDGSSIYYLYMKKLQKVSNPLASLCSLYSVLEEESSSKVIIVVFLKSFDENMIPSAQIIQQFIQLKPLLKITKYIFFEPNYSFVNFVTKNQTQLFEKPNRFIFINDILRFNELLGPPTELIPKTTIELLTQPSAIYQGYVNGIKTNIQIHGNSIQFVGNVEKFNNFEFSTTTVLMIKKVLKHDQPQLSDTKKNYKQFVIETTAHRYFQFLYPVNSNLFEAIINLANRGIIMNNMQDRVKIDSSTLQWLMLNLAFVNAIKQNASMELRKASIKLIYVIFTSFNFKHNTLVCDAPNEDIPDNLLSYVVSISEDLASNYPESYHDFIAEYLNLFNYLDDDVKHLSFCYLKPWIQYWIAEIDEKDQFLGLIISIQKSLPKLSNFFLVNIWENFLFDDKKIRMLMSLLLNYSSFTLSEIIISLAEIDPQKISIIWVEIMKKCIETADIKIKYVMTVISALLASHLFDFDSCGAELIYYTIRLKFVYSRNILTSFKHMFSNLLHSLIRISENEIPRLEYSDFCEILSHESENIFYDEDEVFKWYSDCKTIAEILNILLDDETKNKLFSLFFESIDNSHEPQILANSIMFASLLSKGHEDVLLEKIIQIIKTNKDINVNIAISLSLSVIEFDEKIASKLFAFSIFLMLYIGKSIPLNLFSRAFSKLNNYKKLDLDQEIVDVLIQHTKLPFDSKLCYSTFVFFSAYCTSNTALSNLQLLTESNDNKYSKIYSLIYSPCTSERSLNFRKNTATIITTIIMLLRFRKENILCHLFRWIKHNPSIVSHINITNSDYFDSLLSEVNEPQLSTLFIESYDSEAKPNKIEKIIKMIINERTPKIEEDVFNNIVNLIFK